MMSSKGQRYSILTYAEKCFIVKQVFENDISLSEIAELFQIGESTIRSWLEKIDYDLNNIARLKKANVLVCKRRKPITDFPDWVEEEILNLLKAHPTMGALKIKQYFFRNHQTLLSEKRIYFFLKDRGIIQARQQRPLSTENKHLRRFEYPYPLAAVQLDLLTLQLNNKSKLYLVTFLDDYSRYVLYSQIIKTKTMSEVIRVLMQTIKLHGVMERIICDKGSEFVSWQSFTEFEERLCELDIELIASGPDKPQNQGKIERWHQTYRQECERILGGFDSHAQAQYETNRFVNYYNYERPHQSIGGLVPADRFYGLAEDIQRELSQYHRGNHQQKCIYFSCNINGRRMVVSGPRNGELTIYQNIKKESDGRSEING